VESFGRLLGIKAVGGQRHDPRVDAREKPGFIVMISALNELRFCARLFWAPCPIETIETIAAIPMTMPIIVSQLLSLL